jgi:hypothetical protein
VPAWPMGREWGREKGAWEAATTILKGSTAWSRGGGGWPGVAPHGEEVGAGHGGPACRSSGAVSQQWPEAGGHGRRRRGATISRGQSEQGRGREADRWGRATQCRSARVKQYSNHFKIV